MNLTIFGATGATGTCLVEQALAAGHEVTAVVRDPARLTVAAPLTAPAPPTVPAALTVPAPLTAPAPPTVPASLTVPARLTDPAQPTVPAQLTVPARSQLRVVTADIMDAASILPAVTGADAVLTAVGPRGTGPTTVIHDSLASIIAAMRNAGTRRLLALSGSVVTDEGESPYLRYLIKPLARRTFLRYVCADMRAGEAEVQASHLDWTILRPPALIDGPAAGHYRTAVDRSLPRGFRVRRADLAACMLTLAGDSQSIGHHIAIAS